MRSKLHSLIIFIIVGIILTTLIPISASAEEGYLDKESLLYLEEKYGIEFVEIDETQTDLIEVENIHEFEKLISNAISEIEKDNAKVTQKILVPQGRSYTDFATISWWSAWEFDGSYFIWKNICFNYTYNFISGNPTFLSLSNIDSYITGVLVGVTWNHTGSNYSLTTTQHYHDTANVTVYGYYYIGASLYGVPIGFTVNSQWNGALQLVS
jgi:hypothetical protein